MTKLPFIAGVKRQNPDKQDPNKRPSKAPRQLTRLGRRPPIVPSASTTPATESDYGSDPFEGATSKQLASLEANASATPGAERNRRLRGGEAPDAENNDPSGFEYLRPKIETLQDQIFNKLLPKNGYSLAPTETGLASASDRFQAAAEILQVRGSDFERRIVYVINNMPPGLEKMRSIQRLAPVLGQFRQATVDRMVDFAENAFERVDFKVDSGGEVNIEFDDEAVQAHKFLAVARDHLRSLREQKLHEAISIWKPIKPLAKVANEELWKELGQQVREQSLLDDQLSQGSFDAAVNSAEQRCGAVLRQVSDLTKDQVSELRKSAYQLRRVTDRINLASAKDEELPPRRGPLALIKSLKSKMQNPKQHTSAVQEQRGLSERIHESGRDRV